MGGLVGFMLLFLAVLFALPVVVTVRLFARIRQLERDVAELKARRRQEEARRGEASHPGHDIKRHQEVSHPGHEAGRHDEASLPRHEAGPQEQAPVAAPPRVAVRETESLESRIGGRWLLNIGIVAIVIGVAYFEKLAIDKQWIGETARVIQGAVLGAAFVLGGARLVRRGMAGYGEMLTGGGVAIFYVSTYAAFRLYHLLERPAAFALMVGVTALGAWLADRHRSQGLAVLALGGGFLTPFFLSGNADAQTALFTYVAILIAGGVFLARRHEWPLLNVVSYVFTLLIVAAWADRYYSAEKYLRTELFLALYCAMFVAVATRSGRTAKGFAEFASWFIWTAPVAYYVASLSILAPHAVAMLVWLIAIALVGGALSQIAGAVAGFVVWLAAALPLLGWTQTHAAPQWLTPGLVTVTAIYAVGLAAQLRAAGSGERPRGFEIAWIHLNALLMLAGAVFMLEATHLAWTGPVAAAFALWHAGIAALFWSRDRDRAVHFTALAFALMAIAAALQLDGPAVTVAWAAEGAAVIALGLLERRGWLRAGGALLFAVAILRAFDLLLSNVPDQMSLLNARAAGAAVVVALCYAVAWLHRRDTDASARNAAIGTTVVTAQLLTLALLTREIYWFAALRQGAVAPELLVSLTWAVYATALIVLGLRQRYAIIRYFAIAWFGITIAKVFFSDLAELERIYRVMSIIGLGVMLLLTSYLYQRMRGTGLGGADSGEDQSGPPP